MQFQTLKQSAFLPVLLACLLLLCSPSAIVSDHYMEADSFQSRFLEECDEWIPSGIRQYSFSFENRSLTAEAVVGNGEKYETIQEALNAGCLSVYVKKQRFNITEPIMPPKEDFYIVSDGAEIVPSQSLPAIFDIRNVRYAHFDGLFLNGNGLAEKCIDALCTPSQVPVHQIRNCKIWGATKANVDFTGCEDSLIFNCWIDGRTANDTPDAITEYGVKIGEPHDGYRTGGQVNLIHCLIGFHGKADIYARNVAQLKLANCLLASKNMWSRQLEAHIIVEGGVGEDALLPILELANCWVENGKDGDAPNILIRNRMMSKLTITGGVFYTDDSPNVYSDLEPCAETITLVGAFFENDLQGGHVNIRAPASKLISVGNTYHWLGVDKTGLKTYLIFDDGDEKIEAYP